MVPKKIKILVTGTTGTLVSELMDLDTSNYDMVFMSSKKMNITNIRQVTSVISRERPDIVLHCGAKTAPMLSHEVDIYDSINTNIVGTCNLAMACAYRNIKMVYISTDYVYPSHGLLSNYSEESKAEPFCKYGWSKLGGECAVRMVKNHLILRCSFSKKPFTHEKAFCDSFRSYLYVDEIAPLIFQLIEKNATGVYNVGGERRSVLAFAKETKPDTLGMCTLDQLNNELIPLDSSMDISKMNDFLGIEE
ncbi:sugar nucleotide-binding protein [Candidatus Woesearchaeota archaeon]|jgi:dTDP-4-dehydrorhamnose reductase|nr:sugar nucleotide-binding protein [Candidatus Woesearchaeota archaeon]